MSIEYNKEWKEAKNLTPSEFYSKYWRVFEAGEWRKPRTLTPHEKEYMDSFIGGRIKIVPIKNTRKRKGISFTEMKKKHNQLAPFLKSK